MKIEIIYPTVEMAKYEMDIPDEEFQKVQEMCLSEKGAWAYHTITAQQLPSWQMPAGYQYTKDAFTCGLGEIRIISQEAQA